MRIVTTAEMRELDRRTIEEQGTPGDVLMDRAGQGVADVVAYLAGFAGRSRPTVHLYAGRGNNGGDVFAAARILAEEEMEVEVWLAGSRGDVRGDALLHMSKMKDAGVPLVEVPTQDEWATLSPQVAADVVVDGILGTGVKGPARGPAAGAIQYVNSLAARSPVVAIDIPSGLNADTGEPMGDTVVADVTVTMGYAKRGLVAQPAVEYVGRVHVVDIGIPPDFAARLPCDRELITAEDLRSLFGPRKRMSHKGSYGRLLIVGGSTLYPGAVTLAARAAVRSGVGLVTVAVPRTLFSAVAGAVPEAMVQPVRESPAGGVAADFDEHWANGFDDFGTILMGPGMMATDDTRAIVGDALGRYTGNLVLDADALNVMAGSAEKIAGAGAQVVLTPHPGEMGRLLGRDTRAVQTDRWQAVQDAVGMTGATVVLKGSGTIVARPDHPPRINLTGNPGMACGGMGDVLAGLIAGLWASGLGPLDAASAGAYLHGAAGDHAAWSTSQAGLSASDVARDLPMAFREITLR